ncbi:hypothetical protein [Acetobacter aceti]|nr:hypothetical protein [Acetobacter aceti]
MAGVIYAPRFAPETVHRNERVPSPRRPAAYGERQCVNEDGGTTLLTLSSRMLRRKVTS